MTGPPASLPSHLVHFLPFVLKGKKGTNFEIARGDVDGLGNLAPVMKIAQDFPVGIAVINDEKFTACLAGSIRHIIIGFKERKKF